MDDLAKIVEVLRPLLAEPGAAAAEWLAGEAVPASIRGWRISCRYHARPEGRCWAVYVHVSGLCTGRTVGDDLTAHDLVRLALADLARQVHEIGLALDRGVAVERAWQQGAA